MISDVEKAALDAAVAELSQGGGDVTGIVCDVSDPESVESLIVLLPCAFCLPCYSLAQLKRSLALRIVLPATPRPPDS